MSEAKIKNNKFVRLLAILFVIVVYLVVFLKIVLIK